MAIAESGEMYLETILVLSKTKDPVHSVDVGEYMGFSKPSVSRAISRLRMEGFVQMEADGALRLTEAGRNLAEKIFERHTLLTEYLVGIGVSEEIASEDACRIEHVISDEAFEAIKRHVRTDHGLPS